MSITIHRHRIVLPGLRQPLVLVHLSDTHKSVTFRRLHLLHALSTLKPDLITLTGDLVDTEGDLQAAVSAASALPAIAPVFFVPGNHDLHIGNRLGDMRIVERMVTAVGIETLTNRGRRFSVGEGSLWLGGVDDCVRGQPEVRSAFPPNEYALLPRVLLSHSPDIVLNTDHSDWNVILAGHTHGGQIRLPFIGPIVTNSITGRRFWRGPTLYGGATVCVSQGLGTASVPIRILCPPEVIVLELCPDLLP